MTLPGGKSPRRGRDGRDDSAGVALVWKIGAALGGVGLGLIALLFGVRKIVGPQPPAPPEAPLETGKKPEQDKHPGMTPQGHVPETSSKSAHEAADLHLDKILRVAVALAVGLVASILVLAGLFHLFERVHPGRTSEAAPVVTKADLPPLPGVVPAPGAELLKVRAQEDLHLEHYGWVDAAHTTARIPIERAMTLWVQTYSAPAPPAATVAPVPPMPPTTTNGAPSATPAAPGSTELKMRQEKATEATHVP
jgi:hypothetical protein